jgi:hypothetical protein
MITWYSFNEAGQTQLAFKPRFPIPDMLETMCNNLFRQGSKLIREKEYSLAWHLHESSDTLLQPALDLLWQVNIGSLSVGLRS